MTVAIQAEGLGKRYRLGEGGYVTLREELARRLRPGRGSSDAREIWALRDVDLAIDEGDVVGVVGRNGAGKTTLLKTVARIVRPTTGVVRVRGRVGALLEVGTGFHPELTGRENVFLNGVVLGMSRREVRRRFDEIVEFAGVERFLETPLKRYSSGMYLRLAFAVAAHVDPDVLVVDEVLAVGDAEFQRRCVGRMSELGREGRTVLFVSHDTGTVGRLCSRAVWLDRGTVQAVGRADQVIEAYLGTIASRGARAEIPLREGDSVTSLTVALIDEEGNPTSTVRRDAPLCFDVRLSLAEPHPGLDLGLYLLAENRTQLLSETTSHHGVTIRESGEYALRLTIPNVLAPGTYQAGIRLASEAELLLHEEVLELSVTPRPDDRATQLGRLIQPAVSWDVTKVGR